MTRNYIAGEWVAASEAAPDINPSNTQDVIGEFAERAGERTSPDAETVVKISRALFM